MEDEPGRPFRVLFVCTGNICRSPTAEALFTQRVEAAGAGQLITASSAGVATKSGWHIDDTIAELLGRRAITALDGFRSRELSDAIIDQADLILTGTRDHRLLIGKTWPAAYSRTFTLRECAWLLTQMSAERRDALPPDLAARGRALLSYLQHERGLVAIPGDELDISDPIGRRTSAYRRMVDEVADAIEALSAPLLPVDEQLTV